MSKQNSTKRQRKVFHRYSGTLTPDSLKSILQYMEQVQSSESWIPHKSSFLEVDKSMCLFALIHLRESGWNANEGKFHTLTAVNLNEAYGSFRNNKRSTDTSYKADSIHFITVPLKAHWFMVSKSWSKTSFHATSKHLNQRLVKTDIKGLSPEGNQKPLPIYTGIEETKHWFIWTFIVDNG